MKKKPLRTTFVAISLGFIVLQVPLTAAAAPFPSDQCAVIIASRPTLTEVTLWETSHPQYTVDAVYQASNGYYAISAGLIRKEGWRDTVARLRLKGLVPDDAYCSGRGIVSLAKFGRTGPAGSSREAERALAEANAARDAALREVEEARRQADLARNEARQEPEGGATGSGFRISGEGVLLTNDHVVAECSRITADGKPVRIVSQSATFDLAVLQPQQEDDRELAWLPFSPDPPRLNADVTVAGYPLYGLLGGINVTRGTITSLRGMFGDDSTMQVSAPIQNGNSGGAVSDAFGRVVGVVVSKINNDTLKAAAGVTAENVNFAIRGDIVRLVLDRAGVSYETTDQKKSLLPEDLADKLTAATALITCH